MLALKSLQVLLQLQGRLSLSHSSIEQICKGLGQPWAGARQLELQAIVQLTADEISKICLQLNEQQESLR